MGTGSRFVVLRALIGAVVAAGALFVSMWAASAYGFGLYHHKTYHAYSGETYRIEWDRVVEADAYEITIRHVESNTQVGPFEIQVSAESAGNYYDFTATKSGHFIFNVNVKNLLGESGWSSTSSPVVGEVNGNPASFWIYVQPAPPTGISID